jgi:hypothetical protein
MHVDTLNRQLTQIGARSEEWATRNHLGQLRHRGRDSRVLARKDSPSQLGSTKYPFGALRKEKVKQLLRILR